MVRFGVVFWVWASLAFSAAENPVSQTVFRTRPCAALISAFLRTLPPISGTRRQSLDTVGYASQRLVARFADEVLDTGGHYPADTAFYFTSQHLQFWNKWKIGRRLRAMEDGFEDSRTLVATFDGREAIEAFLDSFQDKSVEFAQVGDTPADYHHKLMTSFAGVSLLASAGAAGATQIVTGEHSLLGWLLTAVLSSHALRMHCDFALHFARHCDGMHSRFARLPRLFADAASIARSAQNAPRWLHWAENQRLSIYTLDELWQQGWGDWVNPSLVEALNADDRANTMPLMERIEVLRRAKQLGLETEAGYDELRKQARGPEVFFDIIVLAEGTLGLKHPRMLLSLRLPEGANQGDEDEGGQRARLPQAPGPKPKFGVVQRR